MFGFFNRNTGKTINVNDMDSLVGKVEIIDIREPYEYNSGSIKSAKNIPMNTLLGNPSKYLKQDKEYYIMCQSGGRSSRTCRELTEKGFDVINVSGGIGSYLGTKRN